MKAKSVDRRYLGGEDGAVLVEFALVAPILILLSGIILDAGFFLKQNNIITRAAMTGARTASSLTTNRFADYETLRVVDAATAGLTGFTLNQVVIYSATSADGALPPGCFTSPAPGDLTAKGQSGLCNIYSRAQVQADSPTGFPGGSVVAPSCAGGSWDINWCPVGRDIDPDPTPDFIGVFIQGTYTSVTGVSTATVTISTRAVYQLEPEVAG